MFKINEIESDIVNHSKVMLYDTLKLSALSKQSEANCCKTIVKKKGAFSAQCIYLYAGVIFTQKSFHIEKLQRRALD